MPNIREQMRSNGMLPIMRIDNEEESHKISIDYSELKEIKGWDVGKKYVIELYVKMVSKHYDPDGELCGDFEIMKFEDETEEEKEEDENDDEDDEKDSE